MLSYVAMLEDARAVGDRLFDRVEKQRQSISCQFDIAIMSLSRQWLEVSRPQLLALIQKHRDPGAAAH